MRQLTIYLLIANVTLLAAYDVLARVLGGTQATISRVLMDATGEYPELAIVIGIVIGHIFLGQPRR